MPAQLRPMKLGEILDQGFSLYRRRIWLFAGVMAFPALIMSALHLIDLIWVHLAVQMSSPEDPIAPWRLGILISLIYSHIAGLLYPIFYPALARAASAVYFEEPVTVALVLVSAAKRWRSWLWLDALRNSADPFGPELLGLCVLAAGSFAQDSFHFDPEGNVMTYVADAVFLVVVLACLWLGACISLSMPAAGLEDVRGFKAIRRGWRLTKGARIEVFFIWSTTLLVTTFLWYGMEIALRVLEWTLHTGLHLRFVNNKFHLAAYYSLGSLYSAVTAPIYPVILTLLYYNQRVRKEGYDVERMIEAAGLTVPAETRAGESVPQPVTAQAAPTPVDAADTHPAGESLA